MSFSMPIQWYHSHADPIWPDGTFKGSLVSAKEVLTMNIAHLLWTQSISDYERDKKVREIKFLFIKPLSQQCYENDHFSVQLFDKNYLYRFSPRF